MEDVACDICGADDSELFAERPPRDDVLHARFVRCRACGAVYASPRASVEEARAYYSAVPARGSAHREGAIDEREWEEAVRARRAHLRRASALLGPSTAQPRFLDIGFGDATALAAAVELGWEAHGLEYSDWLVDWASERLGIETLRTGDLEDAAYPAGHFDVVFSWHVIEHVLDLDGWLGEIHRILAPHGVLVLGTENAGSLYGRLWMWSFRALRRAPWPPTSTDHTHWFSCDSLARILARTGFDASVEPYENSPLSILRAQRPDVLLTPRALAHATMYAVSAAGAAARPDWGGKLVAVATKAQPTV